MKRYEAIQAILSRLKDNDIALFTTGMIGREAFSIRDRDQNFYMIGSMGLVSSVALGMALNMKQKIIVFDGDGSILMDMGTMGMIGKEGPENFIHVILDNGVYESTGGQPTLSGSIHLASVAKAAGYAHIYVVDHIHHLKE